MNNYSASAAQTAHSDFLSLSQFRRQDFQGLLSLCRDLRPKGVFEQVLQGKSIAMIFEKPSLRTRVTFEVAIRQLGGWPIMLGAAESRLGEREPIQDLARNLSCWVDAIVARVFNHHDLEDLALFASIPVINGLSDSEHPCQAVADVLTLTEVWPSFSRKELVYVGDWNNVSRSLCQACSLADLRFRAICPEKYGPPPEEHIDWSTRVADVRGADAIYTDVWASMGQENELAERIEIFRAYQINDKLMAKTGKHAFFMHCLPAHRGQEVTDSVIESDCSLVFQQAANRLPVEKAILVTLLGRVSAGRPTAKRKMESNYAR
ncbi:MAG TPA: ornithine carbamoyltransferase [Terriglobia bacterium]|nr:ornithine carbamoyltransferase [Terriglobia bacterium]